MTDLDTTTPGAAPTARPACTDHVATAAAYSWRLLAIGLFAAGVLWLTGQLLVVVVPLAVAALLTRALSPISSRLRRAGVKPALGAAHHARRLPRRLSSPPSGSSGGRSPARSTSSDPRSAKASTTSSTGSSTTARSTSPGRHRPLARPGRRRPVDVRRLRERPVLSGAIVAGEIVVGALLALIVTFFFLKDGRRFVDPPRSAPAPRRDRHRPRRRPRLGRRRRLPPRRRRPRRRRSRHHRHSPLWLVGAGLVVPVMVITFLAAFVPIVGAVAAGVIAVLVALVTAGTVPALIVAAVAIIVQQLDNDLLAPVIYGEPSGSTRSSSCSASPPADHCSGSSARSSPSPSSPSPSTQSTRSAPPPPTAPRPTPTATLHRCAHGHLAATTRRTNP